MKWLTDEELAQELRIAALDAHLAGRLDLLLAERERRRDQREPRRRLHLRDRSRANRPSRVDDRPAHAGWLELLSLRRPRSGH
jgi:hypothetical protein